MSPSPFPLKIGIIFSFANAVLVSLNLVGAAETTVEIVKVSKSVSMKSISMDVRECWHG